MPKDKSASVEILNKICDVMDDRKLTEVYVREGEITLRVRRDNLAMSSSSGVSQTVPSVAETTAVSLPAQAVQEDGELIKAPMPGMFYRTAAPDEPHFVQEGDVVSEEDTLCLIEAMKIFNPIKSVFPCRILEILVEHDTAVEYDQALFRIKKT